MTTNESSHVWVDIDDGQIIKRCACGTVQRDDGSVVYPDGHVVDGGVFPRCPKTKRSKQK